jgi:hypothetical protein
MTGTYSPRSVKSSPPPQPGSLQPASEQRRRGASSKPERVAENLNVFDFALEREHMEAIEALHDGTRVLHDPLVFTGT